MHMAPQMQCYCPICHTLLSFSSGAFFVQCPQCQTTMNIQPSALPVILSPLSPPAATLPQHPQQLNFLSCPMCQTLLSHPPSPITIQCPRCMYIINVPHKAAILSAVAKQLVQGGDSRILGKCGSRVTQKQQLSKLAVVRKRRKDPDAPKRMRNAYMIFCKERRVQLKLDRPDLSFGQLGKRLGEMWRSMAIEEKRLYKDRAARDRDRYKGEMNSYQLTAIMMGNSGSKSREGDAGSADDSDSLFAASSDGDGDQQGDLKKDVDGDGHDDAESTEGGSVQREDEWGKQNGSTKRAKNQVKVVSYLQSSHTENE